MSKYTLGLREGGLMEDPEWHVESIREVEAENLTEAKDRWAKETGHDNEYWNPKTQTFWGWSVVEVK